MLAAQCRSGGGIVDDVSWKRFESWTEKAVRVMVGEPVFVATKAHACRAVLSGTKLVAVERATTVGR